MPGPEQSVEAGWEISLLSCRRGLLCARQVTQSPSGPCPLETERKIPIRFSALTLPPSLLGLA